MNPAGSGRNGYFLAKLYMVPGSSSKAMAAWVYSSPVVMRINFEIHVPVQVTIMYMYLIAALFPSFSDEIIHPTDVFFNESRIKNHAERLELNEKYTLYIKNVELTRKMFVFIIAICCK